MFSIRRPVNGILSIITVALAVSVGRAQVTQRVDVDSSGAQANGSSEAGWFPAISSDGRFIAFDSQATNLVPGDTNGFGDVFVRDRVTGTTEILSISSAGVHGNGSSSVPSMSADGRYVAFPSSSTNLIVGGSSGGQVFVRDRIAGTTEIVSVSSAGLQGNAGSSYCAISADGRYVAFTSNATNLVASDANVHSDVFVRDRQSGTTEIVSISSSGGQGNDASYFPSISADGRYVSFGSSATNLVSGGVPNFGSVYVRDRVAGTTELVSVNSGGMSGNNGSGIASITPDGRFVVFHSLATNLVAGDGNAAADVFVRDRLNATTERISLDSSGTQGNAGSFDATISADGRYVAFMSFAPNLVGGDTNGTRDLFVRDRQLGTTERINVDSNGTQADDYSDWTAISADGRDVAFTSHATNLVTGDTNGTYDIFVRDRFAAGFTSVCDPGVGGVIACPCSNPPSSTSRGCDNSSATGGAIVSASGVAYLSLDSLVFTTSREKPTATSIVMQGDAFAASGLVFGQGVRCVGGSLKRLYTKTASSGSITAPDFGLGDPAVSSRSAALGDVISAGQSRWYLVYYRDPIVLGGCSASSTFNATQTARIDWSY
jgi:hypothetical protein